MKLEVTKEQARMLLTATRLYAQECRIASNHPGRSGTVAARTRWLDLEAQALGIVQYIEAKIENNKGAA